MLVLVKEGRQKGHSSVARDQGSGTLNKPNLRQPLEVRASRPPFLDWEVVAGGLLRSRQAAAGFTARPCYPVPCSRTYGVLSGKTQGCKFLNLRIK